MTARLTAHPNPPPRAKIREFEPSECDDLAAEDVRERLADLSEGRFGGGPKCPLEYQECGEVAGEVEERLRPEEAEEGGEREGKREVVGCGGKRDVTACCAEFEEGSFSEIYAKNPRLQVRSKSGQLLRIQDPSRPPSLPRELVHSQIESTLRHRTLRSAPQKPFFHPASGSSASPLLITLNVSA